MRVRDHRVQHAVGGKWRFPGKRLVDAERLALLIDQQILRPLREAERRTPERLAGADRARGLDRGRNRFRIRRLVAEGARCVDRAQEHLQEMQRATGVKAVRMRGDSAHRMNADRATDHLVVATARPVRPGLVDDDGLLERDMRELGGNALDRFGREPGLRGDNIGRIFRVKITLRDQSKGRNGAAAIGKRVFAGEARLRRRLECADNLLRLAVIDERRSFSAAREQAVVGRAMVLNHKP